jgi:hypothetical protein
MIGGTILPTWWLGYAVCAGFEYVVFAAKEKGKP